MIYLLHGEDSFLIEQFVKKLKKEFGEIQAGINYVQIDESNVQNLISDIETPAFGYEKKMIIAKNTGLFKSKKKAKSDDDNEKDEEEIVEDNKSLSKTIAEYLEKNKIDDVELVFIEEKIDSKLKLVKIISEVGEVKEFKEKTPDALVKDVIALAKAYGVSIDINLARYFVECVGTNMQDIINELRKVIEYAGNGGTIKKEDIDSLVIKNTDAIIFDLTDNLGKKNIAVAIDILHNLIYSKEPVQKILIMLYNHFKKLYIIKLSRGQNVAENLELKPNQMFLVRKYTEQANYFKEEELKAILEELINLDEQSKKYILDLDLGLESILARYCSK